jgi:hypothetical protein
MTLKSFDFGRYQSGEFRQALRGVNGDLKVARTGRFESRGSSSSIFFAHNFAKVLLALLPSFSTRRPSRLRPGGPTLGSPPPKPAVFKPPDLAGIRAAANTWQACGRTPESSWADFEGCPAFAQMLQ